MKNNITLQQFTPIGKSKNMKNLLFCKILLDFFRFWGLGFALRTLPPMLMNLARFSR
jgi:hypothetical protein